MGVRVRTFAPAVRWCLVGLGLPYVDCLRLRLSAFCWHHRCPGQGGNPHHGLDRGDGAAHCCGAGRRLGHGVRCRLAGRAGPPRCPQHWAAGALGARDRGLLVVLLQGAPARQRQQGGADRQVEHGAHGAAGPHVPGGEGEPRWGAWGCAHRGRDTVDARCR